MLQMGNVPAARKHFAASVQVTPEMIQQWQLRLREAGVEYIVAPYEADAQLAFLSRTGDVAAVISEDSDLLVFGCSSVLTKMDPTGHCSLLRADYLHHSSFFSTILRDSLLNPNNTNSSQLISPISRRQQ